MINILIVDDSETETAILMYLLEEQADINVIGCAKNGAEAVKMVSRLKPDLITMDIQMPVMDGYEATRSIMGNNPTPIVVLSSMVNDGSQDVIFRALEAGALSVLAKPSNITSARFDHEKKHIIETVRCMAEIKVIKRRIRASKNITPASLDTKKRGGYELIAMGASVGGTHAINHILSHLPATFPVPILIVQHMMPGFINGFGQWLSSNTALEIKMAIDDEPLKAGTVYFAPDYHHLEISRKNQQLFAKLTEQPPISGFCPSISALLLSTATVCGDKAIGLLLTGMGRDGAEGLLALKQAAGYTLIQDKESSIVFGMGAVAQTLGAVDKVIELNQIASHLIKIMTENK